MGFIDSQRELGHAVESICRVLTSQGCRIAARTYRAWKHAAAPTRGEVDLAHTINAILDAIRTVGAEGRRKLTPEGLYGRRKMTALLRRQGHTVSGYLVDKAMSLLGHAGCIAPGLMEALITRKDGSHGSTEEVFGGIEGARHSDGGGGAEGSSQPGRGDQPDRQAVGDSSGGVAELGPPG